MVIIDRFILNLVLKFKLQISLKLKSSPSPHTTASHDLIHTKSVADPIFLFE